MLSPALCLVFLGPFDGPTDLDSGAHECVHPDSPGAWTDLPDQPLASIDCEEHTDVGYVQGDPFDITVVTVDGKPVEVETANAFYQMAQAAAADGVTIKINSGFRTMAEQEYFYGCYINCNCNSCNLAAKPGFSNHQSGHALDLNTSSGGVLNWLNAHGGDYGFERTVPSEAWHWEWWGGGPPASGPCGVPGYRAKFVAQSFPYASAPPIMMIVGDVLDASIDLENTGDATWTSNTRLAPTPRDVPSPLYDAMDWLSPTRITGPDADTPPGSVGRFSFRFAATAPGDYSQTFGLVEEGVTWFSDAPKGGGPPDDQLEVHIVVIEDPNPPPPPPPAGDDTAGDTAGDTGGVDPSAGDEATGTDTGVGDSGEGGDDDSGTPTTGGSPGSDGAPAPTGPANDPGLPADFGEGGDDGCGCNTRAPGGWLGLLALLGLARARKRRVIAP